MLTLVDTSVWVDLIGKRPKLTLQPNDFLRLATCPPVLQEVFQGLRKDHREEELRGGFLSLPCLGNPVTLDLFLHAADIYSLARRQGISIRSSTDCLIAAIAIKAKIPVWHFDRDYDKIARITPLDIVHSLS